MSDLISRQAVLDILEKEKSLRCGYDADIAIFSIEKGVRELSTAYDIEKVVAELEEYRANFNCRFCKYNKTEKAVCTKDCTDALIDGLLDILRKGGVE